jgi:hypothetical protein
LSIVVVADVARGVDARHTCVGAERRRQADV